MIWNVNKDSFIRRWQQQAPRVADFDQSITQYIELSNKVQQVDTLTNQEFVLLDCSPLKFSAISHCDEWQNRFHSLLLNMATTKLNDICTSLAENSKKYICVCVCGGGSYSAPLGSLQVGMFQVLTNGHIFPSN